MARDLPAPEALVLDDAEDNAEHRYVARANREPVDDGDFVLGRYGVQVGRNGLVEIVRHPGVVQRNAAGGRSLAGVIEHVERRLITAARGDLRVTLPLIEIPAANERAVDGVCFASADGEENHQKH